MFVGVFGLAFVKRFCVVLLHCVFYIRKAAVGYFEVVFVEKFIIGLLLEEVCD